MIDLQALLVFTAASIALVASPGPDMLLIASRSVSQGRAAGFATLAGIQVGTYVHACAAALGLSQLLQVVPLAYDVVRWAGALYLLYLAWATWRSAGTLLQVDARGFAAPLRSIFLQGLWTNVLNPKMALFVLALFPQFVAPERGSILLQMLLLATVINAIGLVVNGAVIHAAATTRNRLTQRASRWPAYLLSAVFAALAVRLALSPRQ